MANTTPRAWVHTFEDGIQYTASLDGVAWYDSPVPRRWHRCTPQTRAQFAGLGRVERCACGAIRRGPGDVWLERNSRRRERKRT